MREATSPGAARGMSPTLDRPTGRVGPAGSSGEGGRPRCEGHLHRAAGCDDERSSTSRPILASADRPAREVLLVVQVRVEREIDRIVGPHVTVGAAIEQAAALHEPEVSDVVRCAVRPRDDERRPAIGGKWGVLRQAAACRWCRSRAGVPVRSR